MSIAKRAAKNTLWNFFGNNITKVLTLFLTIFIARFFTEIEFGKLSFALSFTGLFIILIDLGTRLLLVREIASDKKNASSYLTNVLAIKITSSVIVFGLISMLINWLNYPQDTIAAVYIGAMIIIFESLSNSLRSVFQAFEKQEYTALTKVIRVVLRFSLTLPLLFAGFKLVPVLSAYLLVQIVNFIVMLVIANKKFIRIDLRLIEKNRMLDFVKRGFPFLLSSAFVMVYFRIDITMLSLMSGDAAVGWYNAAYTLIDALTSIPIALNAALLPILVVLYKKNKKKLEKIYKLGLKAVFLLSIPICFGGIVVANKLILLLFGDKYTESVIALQVLLWVLIPLFVVHILGAMLITIKKEKMGVPVLFFTSLLNIVLNLYMIPRYSIVGAGISTIISELFYFAAYYYIISKEFKKVNLFKYIIKPLIAGLIMVIILSFIDLNVFLMIGVGAVVYALMIIVLKGITSEEKQIVSGLFK